MLEAELAKFKVDVDEVLAAASVEEERWTERQSSMVKLFHPAITSTGGRSVTCWIERIEKEMKKCMGNITEVCLNLGSYAARLYLRRMADKIRIPR